VSKQIAKAAVGSGFEVVVNKAAESMYSFQVNFGGKKLDGAGFFSTDVEAMTEGIYLASRFESNLQPSK
jgi:hypothetical protein